MENKVGWGFVGKLLKDIEVNGCCCCCGLRKKSMQTS